MTLQGLSRVRGALVLGGFFVGLGALAIVWLFGRFAPAEALAQQVDRVAEVTRTVTTHGQRIATVEQVARDLAEERVFVRAQLFEIARATGARVVQPPSRSPHNGGGSP